MSLKVRLNVWAWSLGLIANPLLAQNITSFSPAFGAYNDPIYVDIYGSGFYPGTVKVWFNRVLATTAQAVAVDHIQARVPTNAPLGSNPIQLQVGNGPIVFSPGDFTVIGQGPYVTDFTPGVGSAGTLVTIHGAHFTGVTNVTFNGRNGTSLFVSADSSLQINAPAGVSSGPIVVRSPKGNYTAPSNFFVPPTITGFSPASGRPGTNVFITGTNFLGATGVRFGGVLTTTFTVFTNHTILVQVPTNAVKGVIRVDAPAGSFLTSSNFVVQPTILGFSPGFGQVGTPVTVSGANFNVGTPVVKFNGTNGTPATIVSNVSFGQLTAVVPAGAVSGPIAVTTTDGVTVSAENFYLPAAIASFAPNKGAPGTLVGISGVNFTNASEVTFNGQPAANFFVTNNNNIGAIVPAGVTTGPIGVTTPAGTVLSTTFFYGAPFISSFSPTHGLPGTNVVLTGSNFLGATSVTINGLAAPFTTPTNNTTLVITVPPAATTGPITVITPGGTNTSAQDFVLDYTSDLGVTVTDSPDPVTVGSNLVYTIVVTNGGAFPAPNTRLTNTLPSSVVLKSTTTSQGTLVTGGNLVLGNIGTLAVGGQVTVTVTVAPQATGTITNVAVVRNDYTDPFMANNTQTTTTTVLPLPRLSIELVSPNQVRVFWPVTLTNFTLQFNSELGNTNSVWSDVGTTPVISGNERSVTETNSAPMRFYRLKK